MRSRAPILLVEDDDIDALLARRALNELGLAEQLVRKVDGADALGYLTDPANNSPSLILLDINMPKMDGFEFLKILKSDDELKIIPVVMLTTSDEDQNIRDCFGLGVAGYIIKPISFSKFVEAMRLLNDYWTLSRLPCDCLYSLPPG